MYTLCVHANMQGLECTFRSLISQLLLGGGGGGGGEPATSSPPGSLLPQEKRDEKHNFQGRREPGDEVGPQSFLEGCNTIIT